ncbi:MAG: UvrD-helicase domain-containing protein [Candidatus Krumholzibacteriota bacterium]|nr:UvrD-helicase domain-containing protein [Candidatus Krumholzibacteriota bacterium]
MLDELNPRQREAVLATEGYVLVLAGAGSGKTRVLTERIAFLIREKRIPPERILAFTFTNKAAGEMRGRVGRTLKRDLPFWVGTFHATGLRILRREAHHIGFRNSFAIYDEDDSISLIKAVLKKKGLKTDEYPPSSLRGRISSWKNALVTPAAALEAAGDPIEENQARIYERYAAGLAACNAFDFDDLIVRVVELFTAHPKVRQRYARQFKYVLVDEFQDTNRIQMVMIDQLSSLHRNLFVVGDDDQAIYGWRGASIDNILQFDRVYENTTTIRLEENYRSTNSILEAANAVIRHNAGRKGKTLWSKCGRGEPVEIRYDDDEEGEAYAVRETILSLIRGGCRRDEIAVLYRTHAQSRAIENALRRGGLPYQIIGGVRFYERKEIKDLLGYLKLVANPDDDVNFRRVVNVPRRGIGQVTMDRIEREAAGRSLLDTITDPETLDRFPRGQRDRVTIFAALMAKLRLVAARGTAHDVLDAAIEESGYIDHLMEDPKTAQIRQENVDELRVETRRFADASENKSLSAFLEEIALFSDVDALRGEETVALMTLHNSKGLEYRAILVTGLDEGLLPHFASSDDDDELEEERRLFYVGMTRARERLFLFSASNRMRYGSWTDNAPSRFLREIPASLCRVTGLSRGAADSADLFRAVDEVPAPEAPAPGEPAVSRSRYREGRDVWHPTYGKGTITKVEGAGADLKLTVRFVGYGSKKFLANYANFRFTP